MDSNTRDRFQSEIPNTSDVNSLQQKQLLYYGNKYIGTSSLKQESYQENSASILSGESSDAIHPSINQVVNNMMNVQRLKPKVVDNPSLLPPQFSFVCMTI